MNKYVTIDGFKYAVITGTYIRKWLRSFTTDLTALNLLRLNYVDRGPGVEIYSMTLYLATWKAGSDLAIATGGLTAEQQMANLEASYLKNATAISFIDPLGNPPRKDFSVGVYFTNLNQIIPNYSTSQKPYLTADIELTEAAGFNLT